MIDATLTHIVLGAAALGSIVAFWRGLVAIHRFARHMEDVHEAVTAQLLKNGGSSLVDRVGGLEDRFDEERERQNEMWASQESRWRRLHARLAMPED